MERWGEAPNCLSLQTLALIVVHEWLFRTLGLHGAQFGNQIIFRMCVKFLGNVLLKISIDIFPRFSTKDQNILVVIHKTFLANFELMMQNAIDTLMVALY